MVDEARHLVITLPSANEYSLIAKHGLGLFCSRSIKVRHRSFRDVLLSSLDELNAIITRCSFGTVAPSLGAAAVALSKNAQLLKDVFSSTERPLSTFAKRTI